MENGKNWHKNEQEVHIVDSGRSGRNTFKS